MDIKKITYRIQYFNNFTLTRNEIVNRVFLLLVYTKKDIVENSKFYFHNGCLCEDSIFDNPYIKYEKSFNNIYIDVSENLDWFFVDNNKHKKKEEYMLDNDNKDTLDIIKKFSLISNETAKNLIFLMFNKFGKIDYLSFLQNNSYSKKQYINTEQLFVSFENYLKENPLLSYKNLFKQKEPDYVS